MKRSKSDIFYFNDEYLHSKEEDFRKSRSSLDSYHYFKSNQNQNKKVFKCPSQCSHQNFPNFQKKIYNFSKPEDEFKSYCSTNRSLGSVHSVQSVFQRAQNNYKIIIGNDYPLNKVISIWKSVCWFIEEQIKLNKSIVIPKLGIFCVIDFYFNGQVFKKPILKLNTSLITFYNLKYKKYDVDKLARKCLLNYTDISKHCKMNRFITEEIVTETIKSFEKLINTNSNVELPFYNMGKLQVERKTIRMKFYYDFIINLNQRNKKNKATENICRNRIKRTPSMISVISSVNSNYYKPTDNFFSCLPTKHIFNHSVVPTKNLEIKAQCDNLRKCMSYNSLLSQKTKSTMSLLSTQYDSCCGFKSDRRNQVESGQVSERLQKSRQPHGDLCLCVLCEGALYNNGDGQFLPNGVKAINNTRLDELRRQIKIKKDIEKGKPKIDKNMMKINNKKLVKLLYEERVKNIKDLYKIKQNSNKRKIEVRKRRMKESRKRKSQDYDFSFLNNTPLRYGLSSLSNYRQSKERNKNKNNKINFR